MGSLLSRKAREIDIELGHPRNPRETLEKGDSFNLPLLPLHLQYYIVEKLSYKDFSSLDQTSLLGNAVCWAKTYSIEYKVHVISVNKKTIKLEPMREDSNDHKKPLVPWHVAAKRPTQITAKWVIFKTRTSSRRMQKVAKLFEKNGTRAGVLEIQKPIAFKPADLERLIRAINAKAICFLNFVSQEFFQLGGLKHLKLIDMAGTDFTDDDLLELKCEYLFVNNDTLTAQGLNHFMRQWKEKRREIGEVCVKFETSIGTRNAEEILDDLDTNPIWTPHFHEHSLVGKIKVDEFELMNDGDPVHLYSICRADDVRDTRFIRVTGDRFEVLNEENEAKYLLEYLTEDQHYIVCGKCILCDKKFCKHKRRVLTPRFRRKYPRLFIFLDIVVHAMDINTPPPKGSCIQNPTIWKCWEITKIAWWFFFIFMFIYEIIINILYP